ncbi:uncharacterized protein KY384_008830 [Bacidia gigantensis]|uniref:uncharacterized protein n=1 Tax=Bacidia gigantensis TaxID=2732470 RepID=UPI001D052F32|nr:uncharacterized protein KY384_008830 [Bacidia gigantensis]KAG8526629.1 hypothetical protein KY384_008830 [Bacidia gigantensis]
MAVVAFGLTRGLDVMDRSEYVNSPPCSAPSRITLTAHSTSPLTEEPPDSFTTDVEFKEGGKILSKYDTWLAIIGCLAEEAIRDWNAPRILVDTSNRGVAIKLVRNRMAVDPPLLVKHVMWSLVIVVSQFWEEQNPPLYAETTFKPQLSGQDLGLGQVLSLYADTLNSTSEREGSGADAQNLTIPGHDKVKIDFDPDLKSPALCTAVEFYLIIMQAITQLGPRDKEAYMPGLRFYDREKDFTFQIGSSTEQDDLKQYMLVSALSFLAEVMYDQPQNERFRPFGGKVRWNGYVVAFLSFEKGRLPDPTVVSDQRVSSALPAESASSKTAMPTLPTLVSYPGSTS